MKNTDTEWRTSCMDWLNAFPLRKFLAWSFTLFWCGVVIVYTRAGQDIPSNISNILTTLGITIYGGYFGTSMGQTISAHKYLNVDPDLPPPPEGDNNES